MLEVRGAISGDVRAIAALSGELGYPSSEDAIGRRLAEILAAPATDAVFVGVDDEAVAGWIHVVTIRSLENDLYAEIRGLIVTEARRGRGIGAKLVEAAEAWAAEQGFPRIRVRTNVTRERTHRFYERMGYAEAKTQKVFDKRLA
jgi:GNAT superfamily N-acetyltransferase